jgi:endonuclease YncB( thermonuclease family)
MPRNRALRGALCTALLVGALHGPLAYRSVSALETRDTHWRRATPAYAHPGALDVVDGDTFGADIWVWHNVTITDRVRLLRVDTPELNARDPEVRALAQSAKAFTHQWLIDCPTLNLWSEKDDSFGRPLSEVECIDGRNLGTDLLNNGLAVLYVDD